MKRISHCSMIKIKIMMYIGRVLQTLNFHILIFYLQKNHFLNLLSIGMKQNTYKMIKIIIYLSMKKIMNQTLKPTKQSKKMFLQFHQKRKLSFLILLIKIISQTITLIIHLAMKKIINKILKQIN